MPTKEDEMTLAISQAAKRAGVTSRNLRHAIQVGKLKARKEKTLTGEVWITTSADLQEWQNTRKMGRPRRTG